MCARSWDGMHSPGHCERSDLSAEALAKAGAVVGQTAEYSLAGCRHAEAMRTPIFYMVVRGLADPKHPKKVAAE
jgi:hypothetical protein